MNIDSIFTKFKSKASYLNSLDLFSNENIEEYTKFYLSLQKEFFELIFEPFKEKVIEGVGSFYIHVANQESIYTDIINIYANINSFFGDELNFKLDDVDLYKKILSDIFNEHIVKNKSNDMSFNHLVISIQNSINNKFGLFCDLRNRKEIYFSKENEECISITNFYEQNALACIEKTAVAHNIFKMLNLDSGMLPVKIYCHDTSQTISHALNVVEYDNTIYFIDFSIVSKNDTIQPSINTLTKKQYDDFLCGKHTITFEANSPFKKSYTIAPYNIYLSSKSKR